MTLTLVNRCISSINQWRAQGVPAEKTLGFCLNQTQKDIIEIYLSLQAEKEGNNPPLTRSKAGRRDFDINIDGLAHYGMLLDFIQDLKNAGLTDQDLEPLFSSAEHYIQMWEKCL